MVKIMLKIIQQIRSTIMALEMISMPIGLLNKSMSIKMRAITGRAVMPITVAIKSEKISASSSATPKNWGTEYDTKKPTMKGTINEKKLTIIDFLPCCQTMCRSTSRPAINNNNTMESCTSPSSTNRDKPSIGNKLMKKSGATVPSKVGPNTIPAIISPSTAGCLILRASSAKNLLQASNTPSCTSNKIISFEVSLSMRVSTVRVYNKQVAGQFSKHIFQVVRKYPVQQHKPAGWGRNNQQVCILSFGKLCQFKTRFSR